MRTVASMIEELQKFPPDCVCFAYEGEVQGLTIERAGERLRNQGVIHCSESDSIEEPDTKLMKGEQ